MLKPEYMVTRTTPKGFEFTRRYAANWPTLLYLRRRRRELAAIGYELTWYRLPPQWYWRVLAWLSRGVRKCRKNP